jgi:hypothetical protein
MVRLPWAGLRWQRHNPVLGSLPSAPPLLHASTGRRGAEGPLFAVSCRVRGVSSLDLPGAGLSGSPSSGRHVRRSSLHGLRGTGVLTGVSAARRPSGAWCTPSWLATEAAEYTAYLSSLGWRPKGPAKVRSAWKACVVGSGGAYKKLSSAYAKGLARFIAAT